MLTIAVGKIRTAIKCMLKKKYGDFQHQYIAEKNCLTDEVVDADQGVKIVTFTHPIICMLTIVPAKTRIATQCMLMKSDSKTVAALNLQKINLVISMLTIAQAKIKTAT